MGSRARIRVLQGVKGARLLVFAAACVGGAAGAAGTTAPRLGGALRATERRAEATEGAPVATARVPGAAGSPTFATTLATGGRPARRRLANTLGSAIQGCTLTSNPLPPISSVTNAQDWYMSQCGDWFTAGDGIDYQACYLQCL